MFIKKILDKIKNLINFHYYKYIEHPPNIEWEGLCNLLTQSNYMFNDLIHIMVLFIQPK
jgi:hypothetical protein